MDRDYVLIYTPYITRKGVRIWVSQYGLKVPAQVLALFLVTQQWWR